MERKATFAGTCDNYSAVLFQTSNTMISDISRRSQPSVSPDPEAIVVETGLDLTPVVVCCRCCPLED